MAVAFVRRAAFPVAFAGVLFCPDASALDADATSDTVGQFYDVRSPTGEVVLERRRVTSTLGFGVYDLLPGSPGDPNAPELSLRIRLRYDADYGASAATSDPTMFNSVVPGFSPEVVDLMYAYLEGRRFWRGRLGFKLGRQYVTDVLGWWSFDGGEVSVTTPYFFKAEAYGGLEQRGGLPLSTSRFEGDGVWRGARTDAYGNDLYPDFQVARIAPALGVALESTGVTWIHGRLTYRRVYDTGPSDVSEFASGIYAPATYDGARISSERLGYAMDASLSKIGGARAGIVYDLYRAAVTSAYATIDAYVGKKLTLGVDYDYYVPSFDGDSIWNFFAGEPRNDVSLRANVDVDRRLSISANAHVRIFTVQTAPFNPGGPFTYSPSPDSTGEYFPSSPHSYDEGGNLSARWKTGETRVAVIASGDFGSQGERVGGDLTAEHVFETRYVVGGRAGVWQWKDDLLPDRDATTFQYVANLGYRFAPRCRGTVEWEHDINGLVGQRFRLMLLLSLGVGK